MYIPRAFRADEDGAERFLESVAFGQLVTVRGGLPVATHLPAEFVRESRDVAWLYGHLARRNLQVGDLESGREALFIAQGAHGYVSPAWYGSPDVPTWNYQAVHVYGIPEPLAEDAFREMLERLVKRHESSRTDPVSLGSYPASLIEGQMRAAYGFRLRVTRIEGAFKLSQNKSPEERRRVREGLAAEGRGDLAEVMKLHDHPGSSG